MSNFTVWGVLPDLRTPLLPTHHDLRRHPARRASDRSVAEGTLRPAPPQVPEQVPAIVPASAPGSHIAGGAAVSAAARRWGERHAGIAWVERLATAALFMFFAAGLVAVVTMS
jgi:hypothetical protein